MMPLQFKFGSEKSRVALIAVIGTIFFVITVGVKLFETLNLNLSFLNFIWNNDFLLLGILVCLVILGIYFSLQMSMKIVEKKEF